MSLKVDAVSKSFGATQALDRVTLDLGEGEVLALCGENGAGKSTLMNILAGVIRHGEYEGSFAVNGSVMAFRGPWEAEEAGISLLPQELVYYPDLSVAENVMAANLPATGPFLRPRALMAKAQKHCRTVGLDQPMGVPVGRLSTSERQLVSIARALSLDARILILDEPTAALPRDDVERLFGVIRSLARRGTTVVYITHHLAEVTRIADRVAVLRNGRLVVAPRADLRIDELIAAMTGQEMPPVGEATTTPPAAEGRGLDVRIESVRVGQREALGSVAFSVRRGEIFGLAGLTGAGHDTLMSALAGAGAGATVRGTVQLDGKTVDLTSPYHVSRSRFSLVPRDRRRDGIVPLHPVQANLLLGEERIGSRYGWRRPRRERDRATEMVERFDIRPRDLATSVSKLSGGNQQRVVVARAASHGSDVLLLADPTRGVDVAARRSIHDHIRAAAAEGRVVILASEDLTELSTLSTRVAVFRHRQMIEVLDRDNLSEASLVAAMAAGDVKRTGGRRGFPANQEEDDEDSSG